MNGTSGRPGTGSEDGSAPLSPTVGTAMAAPGQYAHGRVGPGETDPGDDHSAGHDHADQDPVRPSQPGYRAAA
ncbi:hypothetical protein, partial [Streptomyces luteolifulvus]|uniref:hypothetical protein n=1 Tax=Streptomyces luteolifulvus TaxID=2615112 RepID=UPI001CDA35C3